MFNVLFINIIELVIFILEIELTKKFLIVFSIVIRN